MSHANKSKPKRSAIAAAERRLVKAVAKPKPGKAVGRARSMGARAAAGGDTNEYLESLVDPQHVVAKIPDAFTEPSCTFTTTYTDTITTDAFGRYLAAHAPTLDGGGFHPTLVNDVSLPSGGDPVVLGINPDSPDMLNANNLAPGGPSVDRYTNWKIHSVINTQLRGMISRNMQLVRPVSGVIEVTPTAALLSTQGSVRVGYASRETPVANYGTTAVEGTPVAGVDDGNQCPWRRVSDYAAAAKYVSPITKSVKVLFLPDDDRDFQYRDAQPQQFESFNLPITPSGTTWASSTTVSAIASFAPESTLAYPTLIDSFWQPGPQHQFNCAIIPGGRLVAEADPEVLGAAFENFAPYRAFTMPWVYVLIEGAEHSKTVGVLTVTINWECIPIPGNAPIATTPSVSNPLELAMASNFAPHIPVAHDPDEPDSDETRTTRAAAAAARGMYRSKSLKHTIEGRGLLSDLAKGVGGVASMLFPALSPVANSVTNLLEGMRL